jgi:hypothetical protein
LCYEILVYWLGEVWGESVTDVSMGDEDLAMPNRCGGINDIISFSNTLKYTTKQNT